MIKRYALVSILGIVATFGMAFIAGCAAETQTSAPDPAEINHAPAREVLQMPDGFRNVAEACDSGGNMVLVTSRGSVMSGYNGGGLSSGIAIIAHDPRCAK